MKKVAESLNRVFHVPKWPASHYPYSHPHWWSIPLYHSKRSCNHGVTETPWHADSEVLAWSSPVQSVGIHHYGESGRLAQPHRPFLDLLSLSRSLYYKNGIGISQRLMVGFLGLFLQVSTLIRSAWDHCSEEFLEKMTELSWNRSWRMHVCLSPCSFMSCMLTNVKSGTSILEIIVDEQTWIDRYAQPISTTITFVACLCRESVTITSKSWNIMNIFFPASYPKIIDTFTATYGTPTCMLAIC